MPVTRISHVPTRAQADPVFYIFGLLPVLLIREDKETSITAAVMKYIAIRYMYVAEILRGSSKSSSSLRVPRLKLFTTSPRVSFQGKTPLLSGNVLNTN